MHEVSLGFVTLIVIYLSLFGIIIWNMISSRKNFAIALAAFKAQQKSVDNLLSILQNSKTAEEARDKLAGLQNKSFTEDS